jgi:hypothetical protein
VSITPALIQQLSAVHNVGIRIGSSFKIISLATFTGNPIARALIERVGSEYLYAKISSGVAMAVGCLFLFFRGLFRLVCIGSIFEYSTTHRAYIDRYMYKYLWVSASSFEH